MFDKQAFSPEKYDKGIEATLPYYEEYFMQIVDIVRTVFHRPVSWLDIGCGTGKMAGMAVQNLPVKNMLCCDHSPQMLKIAKEHIDFANVEFLETSIQNLRYDSDFDVITAVLLNHYFQYEDRISNIRNCYHALRRDGLFFTIENFASNQDKIKALYLERWKNYQRKNGRSEKECQNHMLRYHTKYFPITITEQIDILQKCGFEAAEIFWCSYMQVGILGIK